jgi:hypothetical protein
MHLPYPGMSLKFHRSRNRALTFTTIHQQLLPLPCYCGFRDLPCNSSILPKSVPHLCCLHVRLSCAVLTGAIISMDVRSTIFEISVPLVLWHAALSRRHHHTYSAHKTEMHYRLLRCTKFPTSMPLHANHTENST